MPQLALPTLDAFAREGINFTNQQTVAPDSAFWDRVAATGTELWLDSGDLDAAEAQWYSAFSALTTNNSLLNAEIQKGSYDNLVPKAAALIKDLPADKRILELAFFLNVHHALRLAAHFGVKVSVEMHTACAHDRELTEHYARRAYAICPQHFIIKIPHTAAGLLATRKLRGEGIPINYTLGFSARQNYLATMVAHPNWVNVFLGRCGAFVKDNDLGDGEMVGERITLGSQQAVDEANKQGHNAVLTKQIAASMRGADNVATLAGVDTFTMPLKVAKQAPESLSATDLRDNRSSKLTTTIDPAISPDSTWEVNAAVRQFAASLDQDPPENADALIDRAHAMSCGDMFPRLTGEDLKQIADDGKIPKYKRWAQRIANGEIAMDTLLNLAGLASFSADQASLDQRIAKQLTEPIRGR